MPLKDPVARNQYMKDRRQKRIDAGICTECGKKPNNGMTLACEGCRQKKYVGTPEEQVARRKYHKDYYKQRVADGVCHACGVASRPGHVQCESCSAVSTEASKRRHLRNKEIVIRHYGGYECPCCKQTFTHHFLQIDHIDGGGVAHRREINCSSGSAFYSWLIKNDFPTGFRVLCANCNHARFVNGGKCPHEETQATPITEVLAYDW